MKLKKKVALPDFKRLFAAGRSQFVGLRGMHPGQWPLFPQLVCALLVTSAVVAGGWYFYWSDQMSRLERGKQDEVSLKQAYRSKIGQAVNLEKLREQKKLVGEYVSTLEKQLPSKAEMDALLSDINQAGLGRGLQFELFKPGQVIVKDYYAELPINIKVTGDYHDVASFTSDIANLPRIVTLNNMKIATQKDGGLILDTVAKTFRYLDEEELAAQRKEKAEKARGKKGRKK